MATMKYIFEDLLNTNYTLHWWNRGRKKLSFEGSLQDLLIIHKVKYTISKTDHAFILNYTFKNPYGITFKQTGTFSDFTLYAKQFLQMELVRMGDKSTLWVNGTWRPTVTVNH